MIGLWRRLVLVVALTGVGTWAACVGADPVPTAAEPSDAGPVALDASPAPIDSGGTPTPDAAADAGLAFRITASPADVGLVRQGASFQFQFGRAGGRGTATVKAQLAPTSPEIPPPGDFTQLEGQGAQTFTVSVGASARQGDYLLTIFANDDATPVAQASSVLKFRVIGARGGIDQAFGGDDAGIGAVVVPSSPFTSLIILPDGKIVAAGGNAAEFVVVRLDADGAFDPTFGVGGIVRDPVNAGTKIAAIALDGNDILAAGGADQILVRRYSVTGAPTAVVSASDPGLTVYDMVVAPDGKLVFAGGVGARKTHFAAKFLRDGGPDPMFGKAGIVETLVSAAATASDRSVRVAALPDGRVVTGGRTFSTGSTDGQIALVRYGADGGLDPTFNGGGTFVYQFGQGFEEDVRAIAVADDGAVRFVSDQFRNAEKRVITVSRLRADGSLDPAWWPAPNPFGSSLFAARPDGGVIPQGAVELDGGAWLVAGNSASAKVVAVVARVSSTATLDPTFGVSGFASFSVGVGNTVASRAVMDGRGYIVVVGTNSTTDGFITRLFP